MIPMVKGSVTIELKGETLQLHPYKALYWELQDVLMLADLHLGKGEHFRRNGIAVPPRVGEQNYRRLHELMEVYTPGGVLFLGDLFHSDYNSRWEQFARFLQDYPDVQFELVKGNHDVLPAWLYADSGLRVHEERFVFDPFVLQHHPTEGEVPLEEGYILAGHVHPGVRLAGGARQSVKVPCFWFGAHQGLLPAFGDFTGLARVPVKQGDRVFVIADDEVISI